MKFCFRFRLFKPLLLVVTMLLMVASANAASFSSSLCGGTGAAGSGGIIPYNSILSGQGTGEQSVLNVSMLIMLTMLLIVGLLFMLSYVTGLNVLRGLAKQEIGEIIVTVIVVLIFLGGFNLVAAGTNSTNVFHAAGTSFGRQTYIDDCTYLSNASLRLLIPMLDINIIKYFMDTAESLKLSLTPAYFGVVISPLQGFDLFDAVIGILVSISGSLVIFILATLVVLGFIFGLFPLFLYAGIILRTIPWTRAAGGAFMGLFIGFYIIFPLLLHVMLGGYISTISTAAINANPTVLQAYMSGIVSGAASGGTVLLGNSVSFLTTLGTLFFGTAAGGSFGLVNGYIFFVIEPASFTMFAIVISFIISFDFAEIAGHFLGAPSLSSELIFSKVI
jgi:hypothetical protein